MARLIRSLAREEHRRGRGFPRILLSLPCPPQEPENSPEGACHPPRFKKGTGAETLSDLPGIHSVHLSPSQTFLATLVQRLLSLLPGSTRN